MPLLRRKKKSKDGQEADATQVEGNGAARADGAEAEAVDLEAVGAVEVSANGEDAGPPDDAAIAMVDAQEEEEEEQEEKAAAPGAAPRAAGPPPGDGDAYGDERLPVSFYFEGLLKFKDDRPPSREELDRQAEADFRAAIAPAVGDLRELVPDSSSPEDALRMLTERWEDPLPDPEGERARGQDPYKRGPAETAVFYRIRRHFENPKRRVGFGREAWRPPPGLAAETMPKGRVREALPSGEQSRRS
jgi:hypothetical protein